MLVFTGKRTNNFNGALCVDFDGRFVEFHQKSIRRTIPNASCFVQSVYSLMMSSPLEVVRCEAAALLVELSPAPEVLQVKTTSLWAWSRGVIINIQFTHAHSCRSLESSLRSSPGRESWERSADSFLEKRLVIEPSWHSSVWRQNTWKMVGHWSVHCSAPWSRRWSPQRRYEVKWFRPRCCLILLYTV